jgi:glycosyltransferase involved in cell wall biosynthesis
LLRRSSFWETTRLFFPRARGLVHTFNDIVINADAWIVSYELELPRFLKKTTRRHLESAYARFADPRCRFILPMSDAARRWFLRRVPEDMRDALSSKTRVFAGGVDGPEHFSLKRTTMERQVDEPLHLVFIGNDSFRKGGLYILDAFDQLRREGIDCRLTFIGRVDPTTYALAIQPGEYEQFIDRLENTAHLTWIPHAAKRQVVETLIDAHIGLLPTLDDSLGWSVIEMMAASVPVIATNIVALPELVDDGVTGLLIDIPRDDDNRWIGLTRNGTHKDICAQTHALIVAGLVDNIAALYNDESLRMKMASTARRRYKEQYTPEIAASRLKSLYDDVYESVPS